VGRPTGRQTRFRLLARLCRVGLITHKVPAKGFRFASYIASPFPKPPGATNLRPASQQHGALVTWVLWHSFATAGAAGPSPTPWQSAVPAANAVGGPVLGWRGNDPGGPTGPGRRPESRLRRRPAARRPQPTFASPPAPRRASGSLRAGAGDPDRCLSSCAPRPCSPCLPHRAAV